MPRCHDTYAYQTCNISFDRPAGVAPQQNVRIDKVQDVPPETKPSLADDTSTKTSTIPRYYQYVLRVTQYTRIRAHTTPETLKNRAHRTTTAPSGRQRRMHMSNKPKPPEQQRLKRTSFIIGRCHPIRQRPPPSGANPPGRFANNRKNTSWSSPCYTTNSLQTSYHGLFTAVSVK
ncbi:unnamed protein product [Ectocarpus fasciculatus]